MFAVEAPALPPRAHPLLLSAACHRTESQRRPSCSESEQAGGRLSSTENKRAMLKSFGPAVSAETRGRGWSDTHRHGIRAKWLASRPKREGLGAWGTGLFQDDVASDIRDDYRVHLDMRCFGGAWAPKTDPPFDAGANLSMEGKRAGSGFDMPKLRPMRRNASPLVPGKFVLARGGRRISPSRYDRPARSQLVCPQQ